MSITKVQLEHPQGKKGISIDSDKYDLISTYLLGYLENGKQATHKQMYEAMKADFASSGTPFAGSLEWYMEWVKIDLEAKKKIVRVEKTSPIQFVKV